MTETDTHDVEGVQAINPGDTANAGLSVGRLRRDVAKALGIEPDDLHDEQDLVALGMDSIRVMRLAGEWRRAGMEITAADLLECATFGEWARIASGGAAHAHRSGPAGTVTTVDAESGFELTSVQHAYWAGRSDEQVMGGVGSHFYFEFDGSGVEPDRLERAVRSLFDRHEMLRCRFSDEGTQHVLPEAPWRGLVVHDHRDRPAEEVAAKLERIRKRESHRALDVAQGEVLDIQLSLLDGGKTRLHVNIDMLVSDATSFRIALLDLAALYSGARIAPAPSYGFAQYIADTRGTRAHRSAIDAGYWRARLECLPSAPALPLATQPEKLTERTVERRSAMLSGERKEALYQRAREHGITPSVLFATAFGEILNAWSSTSRFLLNVPFFDREDRNEQVDRLVGDFTNLVLLEFDGSVQVSFTERARRTQNQLRSDLVHAGYSGVDVVRDLARRGARQAFAPVVFTSGLSLGELFPREMTDIFGSPVWMISQTPQVWLDHQVVEQDGGILLNWDVVPELFPDGVVDAMFEAYTGLVDSLCDEWPDSVGELLPRSTRLVRERVNALEGQVCSRVLHAGFFEWAQCEPGRLALGWGDSGVSYGDLADRALRIAGALQSAGVVVGDAVGVSLCRGPDQVAAVLGVLAAGAVYVPMAPDVPVARRERMVIRGEIGWVLTESGTEWPTGVAAIDIALALAAEPLGDPVLGDPGASAYVIFTSGSTGEPKGVEVSHRAAGNTIDDVLCRNGITGLDRVLAVSALDFDLSVFDVFGLLGVGGAVVLVSDETFRDAQGWCDLVRRWGVTVWNSVPTLLEMLLAVEENLPSLRTALVSGDWVPLNLSERLAQRCEPGCRLVAMGGATEAAIWSNSMEVPAAVPADWVSVPYGFPLRNQCFRVVDDRGRDCPDWVTGELWIGGAGVARGYRGDPELTARRFVTDRGQRWYRTGDTGRYWPDGTLEFLGRTDHQVKVRGHRIELGEIESVLHACNGVDRAMVTTIGTGTHRHLAAVVTPDEGAVLEADTTLDQLSPPSFTPSASVDHRAEAVVVESVLTNLLLEPLRDSGSAHSAEELARRAGAVADLHPLVRLWLGWLTEREILSPCDAGYCKGRRFEDVDPKPDTSGDIALAELLRHAPDFADMLAGHRDPLELLDDPVLSPAAQLESQQATAELADQLATWLQWLAERLGRPVRLAELGAGGGGIALSIAELLEPGEVSFVLVDSSSTLLTEARASFVERGYAVETAVLDGTSAFPRHTVDVVVANNALHRFPNAEDGVLFARRLLQPSGLLIATEYSRLSPASLLTAAIVERGFSVLDERRSAQASPLLAPETWTELLSDNDFSGVTVFGDGRSAAAWLVARCPDRVRWVDMDVVRSALAAQLPAAMIPERIVVLGELPLTANGKVDKAAITRTLETGAQSGSTGGAAPSGPYETRLAELWSEMLDIGEVAADDNFFTLGGDSLLATRLVRVLRERFDVDLSLRQLLAAPSLRDLAWAWQAEQAAEDMEEGVI